MTVPANREVAAIMQPGDLAPDLERAARLHAEGRIAEAEQAWRRIAAAGPRGAAHREAALKKLVELYIDARRPKETIAALVALTEEVPDQLQYYVHLAGALETMGRSDLAIGHYRRLLEREAGMAAAHFNIALLYRKNARYAEALAAYREAVRLGIDGVEEAWSNMGVLYSEMRRPDEAAAMYERALAVDPAYIPAIFNRAALFEEAGQRRQAVELYERILDLDPGHSGALARLAYATPVAAADDRLVDRLEKSIDAAGENRIAREELSFALGKLRDDLGRYDEAFAIYRSANELGKLRSPPYDRGATEAAFDRLIELFSAARIDRCSTASAAAPVFVCGMFRSGSTLVEQILGAHPAVTAGGELNFLTSMIVRRLAPYPERIRNCSQREFAQMGNDYLGKLRELFPAGGIVADKRPDHFLHLGLIRLMFPSARVVYTRRNPLDNCLSIYFQQLGGNLGYATDLENAAHYYRQHSRLMDHWKAIFPGNIHTVDYDALVRSPASQVRPLLEFLGLEWDDRCLDFPSADNLVKTASVWQVREELHGRSSGRWKNYEPHLGTLRPLLHGDAP
jgi:tetratricopeptide (TPR) repeat protein